MRTINFAVKWWMDILTNSNHYNNKVIEKQIKSVEAYQEKLNELSAFLSKEINSLGVNEVSFLKGRIRALQQAINEERETLEDEIDFMENVCEYVKPERREALESYFAEFIAEQMHKDRDKCVYLFTDEKGVAGLTLGIFCHNAKIRNDDTKLSPLPVGVEMWITPQAVDVRYYGENGYSRIFEDKSISRENKDN